MTKASGPKQAAGGPSISWPLSGSAFDFAADNGKALESWMDMNRSLMGSLADAQKEAIRFVAHRLEEDIARQREFLACKSPTEVMQTYSAFVQTLITDYSEEARKLSALAGDIQAACTSFGSVASTGDDRAGQVAPADKAVKD